MISSNPSAQLLAEIRPQVLRPFVPAIVRKP